jgi:hypothetical protein
MAFLYGVPFGIVIGVFVKGRAKPVVRQELTEEDVAKIKKEREELRAEQAAFQSIIGYSARDAYGLNDNPLEGS